jgi:hypothetical protein
MANLIFRESTTATIPASTSLKGSPLSNLEIDGNFRSINAHLATHDTNISTITYDLSVAVGNITTINNTKPSNTGTGASGTWGINITGNAATVTGGVYTTGNQTIAGTKTFSSTISGSITGNAATVTGGVYTTGNQTIAGAKSFTDTGNRFGAAYIGQNDAYLYESSTNAVTIRTGAVGSYKYSVFAADGSLTVPGSIIGSGSSITSLNASNLSSGTVPAARLAYASNTDKGAVRMNVVGTTLYIWNS